MKYLSLFSGVEAASVAWEPLGWKPVAFCEIDAFPSAVLNERFPEVENLGDITKVDWSPFERGKRKPDVVVGGSPCQSFSVAGNREGLKGESGLMFEYIRAVQCIRPRWFVWENVPGAFSSEGGEAFRQLLSEMDALGYGLAWRVLDAQFFGVAQRRERVFLVGRLGDPRGSAEVLFERDCLQWDSQSSREKRQDLAADAESRARCGGEGRGLTLSFDQSQITCPGNRSNPQWGDPCASLCASSYVPTVCIQGDIARGARMGQNGRGWSDDTCYTLNTIDRHAVAYGVRPDTTPKVGEDPMPTLRAHASGGSDALICVADSNANAAIDVDMCGTLTVGGDQPYIVNDYIVRRLTPVECERLQGFPDNWTRIPWRGKPAEECPDGPRYKAMGNSMAVPVMRWIGERIARCESTS